ncbi:unnamed protein product [Prunus armeniaca]
MHILQARFTSAHTSNSRASRAGTVVTIDDDTIETEASAPKQEDVCDVSDTHEDLDEDNYYDCDEDAFVHSGAYSEAQGGSNSSPELASSSACRFSIEPVLGIPYIMFPFYFLYCELPVYLSPLPCKLPILLRTQTLPSPSLTLRRAPKRYPLFTSLVLACTCLVKQLPSF